MIGLRTTRVCAVVTHGRRRTRQADVVAALVADVVAALVAAGLRTDVVAGPRPDVMDAG
jgi:hypothetical protein